MTSALPRIDGSSVTTLKSCMLMHAEKMSRFMSDIESEQSMHRTARVCRILRGSTWYFLFPAPITTILHLGSEGSSCIMHKHHAKTTWMHKKRQQQRSTICKVPRRQHQRVGSTWRRSHLQAEQVPQIGAMARARRLHAADQSAKHGPGRVPTACSCHLHNLSNSASLNLTCSYPG